MGLATRKLRMAAPAAGGGGGFSPDDIAGLVLWLDASDSATISHSSGDVSQWDDKSASGLAVVQASTNKPRTGDATQNGLNVLSFASGDWLSVTPGTGVCGSAHTIFVVFRKTGSANTFEAYPVTLTASSDGNPFDGYNNSRWMGGSPGYSGTYVAINSQTSWTQLTTIGVKGATSTLAERKDGSAFASGTSTRTWVTTSQVITIASRGDGVTKLTGDIAEIVVYDVELTGTDLTDVEDYLATKWGTP